jgi:sigma-54 dependent transcriptional regulator, acetoin dehydrogenase operon transcriptional activator AcoR
MDGVHPNPSGPLRGTKGTAAACGVMTEEQRRVTAAWERFVSGEDSVDGVRAGILLSWYRCRDVHQVDPLQPAAPAAEADTEHSVQQDMLFTRLGGAAGASRSELCPALVSVTDGAGRILASWGPHHDETVLAPGFSWSEACSGTNGMGTALERPGLASVQGAEHWCRDFHQWNCAAIAIRDPVSHAPVAALDVARRGDELPGCATEWLVRTAATFESELRDQAVRNGRRLADAFAEAEPGVSGALLAVDVAGKLVAVNETATALLGAVCSNPAVDPNSRVSPGIPHLAELVEKAVRRARKDSDWRGFANLYAPAGKVPFTVELRPVRISCDPVGVLVVATDSPAGEPLTRVESSRTRSYPPRIPAMRGTRIVLLAPHEIRYAEANSHAVWFVTDQGRLLAATRGIDNVERQLDSSTFLRVHRRYIVNVGRIKEVEPGFKGALTLAMSCGEQEGITVSRRYAARLKCVLGL